MIITECFIIMLEVSAETLYYYYATVVWCK